MKKIIPIIVTALFLLFPFCTVQAAEESRLVDLADLLSEEEESRILQKLNEISERQKIDLVIVTTDSLEGKYARDFADDYYDYHGYGMGEDKDGVLLLVAMESRDWWISTTGFGSTAFTDRGIQYISEQFLPDLSEGEYEKAFTLYAQWCDRFLTQAYSGEAYDVGNMPKEGFSFGMWIGISILVGVAAAFISVSVMKNGMKSVQSVQGARNYVRGDGLKLDMAKDRFLYVHTSREKLPEPSQGGSSTHRSSSGTTHGGGGGKF